MATGVDRVHIGNTEVKLHLCTQRAWHYIQHEGVSRGMSAVHSVLGLASQASQESSVFRNREKDKVSHWHTDFM